jgi:hypothetical protein
MALKDAIQRAFNKKDERGWDKWPKLYILIDLHDVIIEGTYTRYNEKRKYHNMCEKVLKKLSENEKVCLILWTSSHNDAISDILDELSEKGIVFDYVNENPECVSTDILNVEKKPYFDLLFDDKAGFNGDEDWSVVEKCFDDYFNPIFYCVSVKPLPL